MFSEKILIEYDDSFKPESGFIGDNFPWTVSKIKIDYKKQELGVTMTYFRNNVVIFSKQVTRNVEIISFTLLENIFSMNEFEQKINALTKNHLIVYIGYSGCPPCVRIMQNIPKLVDTFPDIEFVKIDAGLFEDFIEQSDKIPLFRLYEKGNKKFKSQYQNSDVKLVIDQISEWTGDLVYDEDF